MKSLRRGGCVKGRGKRPERVEVGRKTQRLEVGGMPKEAPSWGPGLATAESFHLNIATNQQLPLLAVQ